MMHPSSYTATIPDDVDIQTILTLAKVCVILATSVLLLFGTVLPQITTEWTVETHCLNSGVFLLLVLLSNFAASYMLPPKNKRVTTYIVYWFLASLFFDLIWEVPLWTTTTMPISTVTHLDPTHLPWAIVWWSYTIADTSYRDVTPLMVTFEIWWFLGNITGAFGLWYMFHNKRQRALVFFCLCGSLQCYNATVYMFMTWYVDHLEPIHRDLRGQFVFWGMNTLWGGASAIAAALSFVLLEETFVEKDKSG